MLQSFGCWLVTRCLSKVLVSRTVKPLSILVYHRVLSESDPFREGVPSASEFDWQMRLLSRFFTPLSLDDALEALASDDLPSNAVCVTFDDGYRDNLTLALPILKKYQVPATVFVATGFLDNGRMWNDTVIEAFRVCQGNTISVPSLGLVEESIMSVRERCRLAERVIREIKHQSPIQRQKKVKALEKLVGASRLPNDLMLDAEGVIALHRQGVEIGAHTVTHPILSSLELDQASVELEQSRLELESITGAPIKYFAYPNGVLGKDFQEEHRQLAKEQNFVAAVTTEWGVSDRSTDPWLLRRFTPWDKSPLKFAIRMVMNMTRRNDAY